MEHNHLSVRFIYYFVTLLLLVACETKQPIPTATPTQLPKPSDTPMESANKQTEWIYVALGDSEARCCGLRTYPEYYAEHIEQDNQVGVSLHNLGVSGLTSAELLAQLDTDKYRHLIGAAQVITIVITMNDLLQCPQGDRSCAEAQLQVAKANYKAIIEKVLELTGENRVIIRAQTYDNPYVRMWQEAGVFEEKVSLFDRWNQQIVDIATQYGIPVADVYHDFNGPQGDEDPIEKGYISDDGMHNNDAGLLRMAELLRDLGYDPLSP